MAIKLIIKESRNFKLVSENTNNREISLPWNLRNCKRNMFLRFGDFSKDGISRLGFDSEYITDLVGGISDSGYDGEFGGGSASEDGLSVLFIEPHADGFKVFEPEKDEARWNIPHDYFSDLVTRMHLDSVLSGKVYLVSGNLIPKKNALSDRNWERITELRKEIEYRQEDIDSPDYDDEWKEDAKKDIEIALKEIDEIENGFTFAHGSDGEPVISNAKKIKKIGLDKLYMDYQDHGWVLKSFAEIFGGRIAKEKRWKER